MLLVLMTGNPFTEGVSLLVVTPNERAELFTLGTYIKVVARRAKIFPGAQFSVSFFTAGS